MPVMLERGNEVTWLTPDDEDKLQGVPDPYSSADLQAYPVSEAVNNPANDSAEVIEIDIGKQAELDEFGS